MLTPYRLTRSSSVPEQRQMYAQVKALRADGVSAKEAIRRVADANHRGVSAVAGNYYKWRKVLDGDSGVAS